MHFGKACGNILAFPRAPLHRMQVVPLPPYEENFTVPITEDRQQMLQFLKQVRRLLSFLVDKRIPEEVRRPYTRLFETDIVPRFSLVMHEIDSMESEEDVRWRFLNVLGLVGESLKFKVSEFFNWFSIGRVRNTLKSANSILGSLSKIFAGLDPIKEFKDHLELRLSDDYMNSRDDEITRLGP